MESTLQQKARIGLRVAARFDIPRRFDKIQMIERGEIGIVYAVTERDIHVSWRRVLRASVFTWAEANQFLRIAKEEEAATTPDLFPMAKPEDL
jgi:hypothetical protein